MGEKDKEKSHYKVKAWMVNCSIREQQRYTGELKLTWEVCQEDGISSYKMRLNPKYAVIDELRKEKLLLHSPVKSDDTTDNNNETVEKGGSKYVYNETEEPQEPYTEQGQNYSTNEQYDVVVE